MKKVLFNLLLILFFYNANSQSAKQIFEINPKLLDDNDFLYLAD